MALKKKIAEYRLDAQISTGSISTVWVASRKDTRNLFAVKAVDLAWLRHRDVKQQLCREIEIADRLMQVTETYIVPVRGIYKTGHSAYIVMDLIAGGTILEKVTAPCHPLPEGVVRSLFQKMMQCVVYCHQQGVYHQHLRLENFLFAFDGEEGAVKLSVFGMHPKGPRTQLWGTFHYTPPEHLDAHGLSIGAVPNEKSDVYSCGVMLFKMLTQRFPFDASSPNALLGEIRCGRYGIPHTFPEGALELVMRMLEPNPAERCTLADVVRSKWFREGFTMDRLLAQGSKSDASTTPSSTSLLAEQLTALGLRDAEDTFLTKDSYDNDAGHQTLSLVPGGFPSRQVTTASIQGPRRRARDASSPSSHGTATEQGVLPRRTRSLSPPTTPRVSRNSSRAEAPKPPLSPRGGGGRQGSTHLSSTATSVRSSSKARTEVQRSGDGSPAPKKEKKSRGRPPGYDDLFFGF